MNTSIIEFVIKLAFKGVDLFFKNQEEKKKAKKNIVMWAADWDKRILDSADLKKEYDEL